ncbi:hypothetical protein DCAR_0209337 [Daucus carota subsp. sativus]|uniref:Uncharacterized protein n=1 Tax=Daucus carota subsp. sativus TaxID=79200 RepID=A0A161XJI2_DAUCS|nr:PREDICTED: 33 kDa ribonucleoprotein, chloroplastic-like [Daucus carota subsp. sativus]WOG90096.1 hypothetical protein DCAR_0209337 [Daucus carota subsp. sativus]
MAALEAAFTLFSSYPSFLSSNYAYPFRQQASSSINLQVSTFTPTLSVKFPLLSSNKHSRKSRFQVLTAVEEEIEVEKVEENVQLFQKRKLFVYNLPWSLSVADIKNLFSECGTVIDIEIIKKNGKSKGYAFVTMSSPEEAQAVVEKFDSQELSGRLITVEFAKRLKKPSPPPPDSAPPGKERYKLYVSNLAWKVRANDLREFFAANYKPVSTRVVFNKNPSGNSAGYGFVSFATREEAETAISDLNGKELLGRPIALKFSEKSIDESASKEIITPEEQPEES